MHHEIKYPFVTTDPEKGVFTLVLNTGVFKTVTYTPAPETHVQESVR